jgi:ABC-2 type transport system permease protein
VRNLRLALDVARWEFRRFCKLKDQVLTLVFFLAGALVYVGVMALIAWDRGVGTARIVVLHPERLELELPLESSIEVVPAEGRSEAVLREEVRQGRLDGLLLLRDIDEAVLVVSRERFWQVELKAALDAASREARLRRADLSAAELDALLESFRLDVAFPEADRARAGRGEKVFAGIFVGLMLLGVLLGNSYLFIGITGEKQQRVTEQVIAAIPPQVWIDGKILGLSAVAFVSVVNLCVGGLLGNLILRAFGRGFSLPVTVVDPILLGQLAILALLGFFLWFAFFGAIAATIDDPNTSARSAFVLLPFLPLSFAFAAYRNPDSLLMTTLGWIPLTSPTLLPVRLVLTEVSPWTVLLATALLIATIGIFRRAAGKIFALGVLMHGKEPSWREMWRWIRA